MSKLFNGGIYKAESCVNNVARRSNMLLKKKIPVSKRSDMILGGYQNLGNNTMGMGGFDDAKRMSHLTNNNLIKSKSNF